LRRPSLSTTPRRKISTHITNIAPCMAVNQTPS
jgi:hypothetical protein